MLFNSYIFIFAFLPITFTLYFLLARYKNGEAAITFLVLASLFFYGWWNPAYLVLMLISIGVNYTIGESIVRYRAANNLHQTKLLLTSGIIFNLGLLGYFKYANFIFENTNLLLGFNLPINEIILPLAISFFTFQQVAYLIDAYKAYHRRIQIFSLRLIHWFWEPAHYKTELGELILADIFDTSCVVNKKEPVGIKLNKINMKTHLINQHRQRSVLLKNTL